jgi:poly(hydroxyalkanoate) depolymerase family esterase
MRVLSLLLVCLLAFSGAATDAGTLTGTGSVRSYTLEAGPYSDSQPREYKVYTPRSYDGTKPVAMVVALHGCAMTHDDALDNWNWDLVADDEGIIVVFPFVTGYTEMRNTNCWGYWFDQHIHEGRGEVEDLHRIARQVEANYRVDPERRYVIGLSSGGGMAVASAIAYNEYWAAAASVAGLPYGDWASSVTSELFRPLEEHVRAIRAELDDSRSIPLLVLSSRNDEVVRLRAAELIRDSHLAVFGGDQVTKTEESCSAEGIACQHSAYRDEAGPPVVETVFYDGAVSGTQCGTLGCGHYYGGEDDDASAWAYGRGPSTTQIAWEFFARNTLSGNQPPVVTAAVEVEDSNIRVTGSASDPDGTVVSVEVVIERHVGATYEAFRRIPVHDGPDTFTLLTEALPDGVYKVRALATDDQGATAESAPVVALVNYEAHPPVVSSLEATVTDSEARISGTVEDVDGDLDVVTVTSGSETVRAEIGDGTFSARLEGLAAGDHTAVVTARDHLEQIGSESLNFTVTHVPPPSATGTIQEHCQSGRIPWSQYGTYFLMYGPEPFPVYRWPDGTWRDLEPPTGEGSLTGPCFADTLSHHTDVGRAYFVPNIWGWWLPGSYYARGSGELLGKQPLARAALMETAPDYWVRVDACR